MKFNHLPTCERLYEVVVESMRRLGGEASLSQIYRMCEEVDPDWDAFSVSFKDIHSSVRWEFQMNCAESKNFNTKRNRDVFRSVSRGVWKFKDPSFFN